MSNYAPERALLFAPLLDHPAMRGCNDGDVGEILRLSGGLGTRRRHIGRLKVAGVTVWEADRFATALGLHPTAIWGDAFDEAMDHWIERWSRTKAGARALAAA